MTAQDIKKYVDEFPTNYSYHSQYSDADKVMCYLTGTRFENCGTIYGALERKFQLLGNVRNEPFNSECESQFFTMRFYKKGTLHVEFKDKHLWEEFNLRACAGKMWLPENEMKQYQERREKQEQPAPEPIPTQRQIGTAVSFTIKQAEIHSRTLNSRQS